MLCFEKYIWGPKSNVDVYNVIKTIDETNPTSRMIAVGSRKYA
jgi:hypothetical protein